MTVTVVTRWATSDVEASTKLAKRAKALWLKNEAQDFRLSQIYTGTYTGQLVAATVFTDMAAYAKGWAAMRANTAFQKIMAEGAKLGTLVERDILIGIDL